jgi:hypothetical protein
LGDAGTLHILAGWDEQTHQWLWHAECLTG